jgi:DICT domain-containing protein/signal transduction histidine kinase
MMQSRSLLQDLLQALPDVKAQVYFKATLTAISHAMEDLVLAGLEHPLIIANFQQERFYRQEAGRYLRIAQCTDQLYVLAEPETNFTASSVPYPTIGLDSEDELVQEWHLVIISQHQSACLICREHAAPREAIALDSARQFRGFWTFDPVVSKQAALLLLQRIRRYRPDLASQIKQAKQRYKLAATPKTVQPNLSGAELNLRLFSDRLVTYLQASQYKQVKSYRRLLLQEQQEQQEHLVNQITATIRQTLKPEDVLSATIQEVSRLFEHCRCLLYRLPAEPSDLSLSSTSAMMQRIYESTHPSLPSLSKQNWSLANYSLFQPILNQGNIVAIADTTQDSGIQANPDLQQALEQAQIQACLLVPICYQQQCLAVLELHQSRPYLWSITERNLLTAIAAQVGLVLLQAEAYVNLQQLNQQLIANKQAQTNLIAIVGHELRTPLSTIQVCLESLEENPEMPIDFQQSMVKAALTDSARLRKLVQDFMLLSRLESNLTTWQLEPLNLEESISLAVTHLQAAFQPRALPIIAVNLPPKLPQVIADGEAVFQLLSRVLDNACKFTPPTGLVTLTVRQTNAPESWTKSQSQPMLEIEIADTGCGIESYQLETIFEQFHQEENFLDRAVGGTGLGLAICQQLALQMEGRIWATSQGKGRGSQFFIALPISEN